MGPTLLAPGSSGTPDRIARWLLWPLGLTLVAVFLIFYTLYSPLVVAGDSMEPSLRDGERLLRTKSYAKAERGDVVIIAVDKDDLIKRVAAVGGDTIEIRSDIAFVNGVQENTSSVQLDPGKAMTLLPYTVPAGYVFVLGDNRPVALDSRTIGPVPLTAIEGRAEFVLLPLSRFGPID